MAAKQTCFYKFPLHPQDMFERTPATLDPASRGMRAQFIGLLADMSQKFSQEELDSRVMVDSEEGGEIIGLDMSGLMFPTMAGAMCSGSGKPVPLGRLTADHWIHMHWKADKE